MMTERSGDPGNEIDPSGFFVCRSPLLPLDAYWKWGEGLRAPECLADSDDEALEAALAADRATLTGRILTHVEDPVIQEALFVASPDFHDALERADRVDGRLESNVERSLVKYFARLTGRATPFGLFAGCAVGRIDDASNLQRRETGPHRRTSRLDTEYLVSLIRRLIREPDVLERSVLWPNSSLYPATGRWHYVERRRNDGARSYHLVSVDDTPYLRTALAAAADGVTIRDLTRRLAGDDVTPEEALTFVADLIENQILVSDFEPEITGDGMLDALVERLGEMEPGGTARSVLVRVREELKQMDEDGLGIDCERYREVATRLEALPTDVNRSRLFQVDMTKDGSNLTLGRDVLQEIVKGAELIRQIMPVGDRLPGFRRAFRERYENREIKLVEALDEEIGIGFPEDAGQIHRDPREESSAIRDEFLLNAVATARARGEREWRLTDRDVERLRVDDPLPFPRAFNVEVTLAAASDEALEAGDYSIIWNGGLGPSGANLLGRFCHTDDELQREVVEHLRHEERTRPDAVFAEVVHLPEARVGNVIHRPVLREYEIPFLGRSGAPSERQIPVSDLWVSMVGDRVVLRSETLDREVIPRITTAHNFVSKDNVPLYRFLCSLQQQNVQAWLGWYWGAAGGHYVLPRVTYDRLVLAPAQWRIPPATARRIRASATSAERYRAVQEWRETHGVPRRVVLEENDRELPLDLDAAASVAVLVHKIEHQRRVVVTELPTTPENAALRTPEGSFVHQLIIPLVRTAPPPESPPPRVDASSAERRFPPGSEWHYLKLFTGWALVDRILCDDVGSFVAELQQAELLEDWFFVRYPDPDPHLRLRFRAVEGGRAEVRDRLERAARGLMRAGLVWKVQFDTYEREVERYGGLQAVELAESIFSADSRAVLDILQVHRGDGNASTRELLTIRGMHDLLRDFDVPLTDRIRMFSDRIDHTSDEARALRDRYRDERQAVEELLAADPDEGSVAEPLRASIRALARRSRELKPLVPRVRAALDGEGPATLGSVLVSYMHMHVNRMLRSRHSHAELWTHVALERYCRAEFHRAKA